MRFATIALLGFGQATASSTTFTFYLDGILSAKATSLYLRGDGESAEPVQPTLLKDLSSDIMEELVHIYNVTAMDMITERLSTSKDLKDQCVVAKDDISCQQLGGCGKCVLQCGSKEGDMGIDMALHLHQNKENIAIRTEVTLTAPTSAVARETLTRMVPSVEDKIGCNSSSIWSIQHQPSIFETLNPDWNTIDSVTAMQEDKDRRAASVEETILGNPMMKSRTRLQYSTAEDASSPTSNKIRQLEVWSYEDAKYHLPVKSLFVDGYLAATTASAGIAHAEALVHPAMVAHPLPARALVISLAPNAIIKEILKYKSIEHVSVLGSDTVATEMISKYMPSFNDCSFLSPQDSANCMTSSKVEVIKTDLQAWLQYVSPDTFDVVYVDVPIGKQEWLSVDVHKDLRHFLGLNSVVVVNSGSSPSLFEVNTETLFSPREGLIRQAAKRESRGGLGYDVFVYDEVSFIVGRRILALNQTHFCRMFCSLLPNHCHLLSLSCF